MVVLDAPKTERSRLRQEARQRLAAYPAGLQTVVRQVVDLVHPLRVILFGSQARGDARPESDWDLMVVVPEGTNNRLATRKLYGGVESMGCDYEFIVATPGTLEKYKDNCALVYKWGLQDGWEVYVS